MASEQKPAQAPKKNLAADFARESLEAANRYHETDSGLPYGSVAGLPPGWVGSSICGSVGDGRLKHFDVEMRAKGYRKLEPELWESILDSCSPAARAKAFETGPMVPGVVGAVIYVAPDVTGERHFEARKEAMDAFYASLEPRTEKKRLTDEVVGEVLKRLRE